MGRLTAAAIATALDTTPDRSAEVTVARRRISAATREVDNCRDALADVTTPTARRELLAWLEEAAVEKDRAEGALDDITRSVAAPVLSVDDILAVLAHHNGLVAVLEQVGDSDRAALYDAMHVSVVFDPGGNEIRLGADPVASTACRRGDLTLSATRFG
ncbi:MAG: hypothetical protein WEB19_02655 [Acidimicrobiia bacterium]